MNKNLEETITQAQKIASQEEWQGEFEELANIMLDNRSILQQFYKTCKQCEHLTFYLTPVTTIPPTIFIIAVKYFGQAIATISITKDNQVHISTEPYNKSNKDNFECTLQLNGEEWNSKATNEFLQYFRGDIKPKNNTGHSITLIEELLLQEFSKTNSAEKLLTGIQPIKYEGIYFPIPTIIKNPKSKELECINILARSKVRKISVIEVMNEEDTQETAIQRATNYAIFLLSLLHTEDTGNKWYKLFGFHGRNTVTHTIKVVIAGDKASKIKEFEPYEINIGADTLQFHFLEYQVNKDNTKITNIKTTLNEQG